MKFQTDSSYLRSFYLFLFVGFTLIFFFKLIYFFLIPSFNIILFGTKFYFFIPSFKVEVF